MGVNTQTLFIQTRSHLEKDRCILCFGIERIFLFQVEGKISSILTHFIKMVSRITAVEQHSLFYLIIFAIKVCNRQLLKFTPSSANKTPKPFISPTHNFIIIVIVCLCFHIMARHTAPEWFGVKGCIL